MIKPGVAVQSDTGCVWADSAAVNTHKQAAITKPSTGHSRYHEIIISNPSLVTDLTAKAYNVVEDVTYGTTLRSLVPIQFPAGTSATIEKSTKTVIEDCEDAWNEQVIANVTPDVDAVDFKVGANSALFTIGADAAAGIIGSESIASTNMTSHSHIRAWVKSSVALAAGDMQLLLDNTANCASPLEELDIPALTKDTWTLIHLPLSDPDALTAIISIGLKMITDKGAFEFRIDDVSGMVFNTESIMVDGFLNGMDGIVDLENTTVLGADEGFTATVRVLPR